MGRLAATADDGVHRPRRTVRCRHCEAAPRGSLVREQTANVEQRGGTAEGKVGGIQLQPAGTSGQGIRTSGWRERENKTDTMHVI